MNVQALQYKAAELRVHILRTALKAGKAHVPPAFSWVEIAVALFYGRHLNVRPHDPKWEDRDRFILSKGHGCLTLYAMLADLGFFPKTELDNFCGPGSLLAGHPDTNIPGVEGISGSLGHGLGLSAGLALGAKLHSRPWKVVTVMGDGECQEGSVWEAAMFASHHQLHNLVAIIDRNGLGATNYTENNVALEPFAGKWEAFGWTVIEANGNEMEDILSNLKLAKSLSKKEKPILILMKTEMGAGVDFMEGTHKWHGIAPNDEDLQKALAQLEETLGDY